MNQRIEDIIVDQHKDLRENNVKPAEIKAAIEEAPERKVLLLLDGYDLYVAVTAPERSYCSDQATLRGT